MKIIKMAEFSKLQKAFLSACVAVMAGEVLLGVLLSADRQCNLAGKYSVLSEYSAHLAMTGWAVASSSGSRAVLSLCCLYLIGFHCCMFYPVLLKNVKLRNSECAHGWHEQVYQVFAVTAVVFSSLLFCLTVAGLIVVFCARKSYIIGKAKSCLRKRAREKACLKAIDSSRAPVIYTSHYRIRFPVSLYSLSSSLEKAEVAYLYRYCTVEAVVRSGGQAGLGYTDTCCLCSRRTTDRSIILPSCWHAYHKLCLLFIIKAGKVCECVKCRHMIRPQIFSRMESLLRAS